MSFKPESNRFFVHKAVFSTGERFPVVLNRKTSQPVMLATRYIIDERRETRQSSTLDRDVRVLCWFYEWCSFVGIDLEQRLRSGNGFVSKEIQGVARWLRSGRHKKLIGSIGKLDDQIDYKGPILQPQTFNSYLAIIESFLVWATYEFVPKANLDTEIDKNIQAAKRRINRIFKSYKAIGSVEQAKRYGLTRVELDLLRDLICPRSKQNPFRIQNQFRNQLILETMLSTGVRAGELLKLRVQDIPRGPKQTLSIVRQPDDLADPRKYEPSVKTRSREIPIPRTLAVKLAKYVQSTRGKCEHQYLFTSSRQNYPLSKAGLSNIFSVLHKYFQDYRQSFHPHLLRHTFNDLLMERAKEIGMDDDVRGKVQNYLNGWAEGSFQGEAYTRRFVESEALQIVGEFQNKIWDDNNG
ncbi:site-specific integrase [Desulfovibrio gilichinskyi]|uniref:Phage integrase family protein n=1 Tax=Desulfovibrio gilichinskyi TaxID=1519643 RepID=A0A1X7DSS2_9BACT|nr:site-specific integrase [Desulfovibrio gilichinskyi]SMF20772.1 Phage integrase family protein [Desulfovibrio gilichinskyi]